MAIARVPRLTEDDRGRFGVTPEWAFGQGRRVAWSDVDPFGHCNHLSILRYFEDVRNAYLEAVGLPRLSYTTPGPVLARVEADYLAPLRYGDEILVTARTATLGRSSFEMAYAAWREGCCARGTALCILMINESGAKVQVPEAVRAAMIGLDRPQVR